MISLLHPMVQILCCVCLCADSFLLTNMIDEEIQSITTSSWGQFVDNTWLMSTRRCALHARGPWNFVFCFYHTASRTMGHGTVCHARPCSSRLCGRLSINIFTTLLSIAPHCLYSQTLTVSVHKSLHLNLTLLFHWFDHDGDLITVIGGNRTFGPYTEARDPFSLFMKSFTAKISFILISRILVNRHAFEFTYQPSRIQGLNTYQLHPFEYLIGYGPWWIATFRVVINRIYQIKLHLTHLSCNLLRELIVFDGPGLMPGILNDNKFNSFKNTNGNCGNYTILATTFQVYIAWMSIQSPDILGTIDYENSQPTHGIDIDGDHSTRIYFVRNEASLADVTAWQYVYNIQCAINHHIKLNINKVYMKGLIDSQCHYGAMAVYNSDNNDLKLVVLWCESIGHLDRYYGILNLTSTENRFSVVLYGYSFYFEMEVQFDVSFTECIGLFFCTAPRAPAYVQSIEEYHGSIGIRMNVPCKDCILMQFICLPYEDIEGFVAYSLLWDSSHCTKDGTAVVNITDFPSRFFSTYNVRGLFFTILNSYSDDLTQAQIIGGAFEIVIIIDYSHHQRIQTVHFKNSPCSIPCKHLQLNRQVLDSLQGSGQTQCYLCNPYPIIGDSYIQPMDNTCMEIRTWGMNCENVTSLAEIRFSQHYTIQVIFDGNIDLYFSDMYSNFYMNTDAYDTGCLTFVKFSNSLLHRHPALYFDKQFVYKRGRFASYTGSQMTWREIEHFCIAQGQQMVTVNNIEEQYELVQFAKSYLIQDGVPLGIWRDVGIRFKCVEYNDTGSPLVIWIPVTTLHNSFSVENEISQLDHKCYCC